MDRPRHSNSSDKGLVSKKNEHDTSQPAWGSPERESISKTWTELSRRRTVRAALFLYVAHVLITLALVWHLLQPHDPTLALFSPANHVVRYKTVVFDSFRNPRTKYMPPDEGGLPDDDTDMAWEDLYKAGISKIPRRDAARLVNWTQPVPGDEGQYITMLDVFHQLHCLNIIRRALYPARYKMTLWDGHHLRQIDNEHLEHCVDSIRQLITCHSDVSTHYWRYEDWHKKPGSRVYSQVAHTCRDFDKIRDWAVEHRLRDFNFSVNAKDPLRRAQGFRIGPTAF